MPLSRRDAGEARERRDRVPMRVDPREYAAARGVDAQHRAGAKARNPDRAKCIDHVGGVVVARTELVHSPACGVDPEDTAVDLRDEHGTVPDGEGVRLGGQRDPRCDARSTAGAKQEGEHDRAGDRHPDHNPELRPQTQRRRTYSTAGDHHTAAWPAAATNQHRAT